MENTSLELDCRISDKTSNSAIVNCINNFDEYETYNITSQFTNRFGCNVEIFKVIKVLQVSSDISGR